MTSTLFDINLGIKLLGKLLQDHDIQTADMLAVFPTRPTTETECAAVARWVGQVIMERKFGRVTPGYPLPTLSAQAKPKYVTAEMLPEGNYAVPGKDGGKTRFYRVSHKAGKGKWAGTTFVNIKERASDALYDMHSKAAEAAAKWSIVDYGFNEAGILFSEKFGRCRFCFQGLTDENNPYKDQGAGPDCGPKYLG